MILRGYARRDDHVEKFLIPAGVCLYTAFLVCHWYYHFTYLF